MTPITETILSDYQVRRTYRQRTDFIRYIVPILQQNGWNLRLEKGSFGVRNLVIGDPDTAKVIYTAHYDTCSRLPFPNLITPKAPALYILYQFAIVIFVMIVSLAAAFLGAAFLDSFGYYLGAYGTLALIFAGPANKHNANDNTSGVTAVLELAMSMPPELRDKCAFVLFDQEEAGLFGSADFARKHKNVQKNTLVVNMDCVSDGETMIFCFRKNSRTETERFRDVFTEDSRIRPEFLTRGYIAPSDQIRFNRGVGVFSMKRTKRGLLYMDRIHTKRDTVYRLENIEWLVEGCTRLAESI